MTIQQLEYVVALDNERHFVRAAEKCFITQPTLTMQLKKLEEEIGVKIFDRDSSPLKPTFTGEQIVLKARQILGEIEQLRTFLSDDKNELSGNFTIGVIPTVAPYLLPLFLPYFVENYPNTTLVIKELQTEELVFELQKGTVNIGILATPLDERSLREISLFYESFLAYFSGNQVFNYNDKFTLEQINNDQLLYLEKGHCFREQVLSICKRKNEEFKQRFHYESGSIEALKSLVDCGLGHTLIPELASNTKDKGISKRFENPEPVREISLVVHNSFTKEALIEALHKSIQNTIPKSLKKSKSYMKVTWR
jgi:LysR family hydrogen peroxide-inducible transcriptional activator